MMRTAKNVEEALRRLRDAILTAQLAPANKYPITRIRNIAGVDNASVLIALEQLSMDELVSHHDEETATISPIKGERIKQEMALYESIEVELVKGAAANMTAEAAVRLSDELQLLNRAASLGDLDTAVLTDRRIELIIASLPPHRDEFEQLITLKLDFKRKWCAEHRLKDFSGAVDLRRRQVEALIRGDATAAVACVRENYRTL